MALEQPSWTPQQLDSPHEVADKAARVRRMFDAIAPRYELINSLFSARRDSAWRRKAVQLAKSSATDNVLDIACGTGDFARAFAASGVRGVTGCDFAHEMLTRATRAKESAGDASPSISWCEADAQNLPFRSSSFSITSCAFGVRNFQELDKGLAEMRRVLKPGGRAVILEFTRPKRRIVRGLVSLYTDRIMPLAATWISGDRSGAYRYLPRSVVSFLTAKQMCERLRSVGFEKFTATPLTLGVVTVYVAWRSQT